MRVHVLAVAVVAAALLVATTVLTPRDVSASAFSTGTWSYTTWEKGTKLQPLAQFAPFHITVYAPVACASRCGPFATSGFPVYLFSTGFAGQLAQDLYGELLVGIVRQGIIVVVVDQDIGLRVTQNYRKLGAALQTVVGYIYDTTPSGLAADLVANGVTQPMLMPGGKIFFGGHSSGNHIVLEYINQQGLNFQQCNNVAGVAMISPLDGADPLGFGGSYIIPEGVGKGYIPFSTPGLMVTTELDPVPGIVAGAACVPDNRGAPHFYYGWNVANIYWIKVMGVGHLDILSDTATTNYDAFCAEANSTNAGLRATYRLTAKGAIVTFLTGLVNTQNNQKQVLSKLTSTVWLPTMNPKQVLANKGSSSTLGCSWSPIYQAVTWELQLGIILFCVFFFIVFFAGLWIFFRAWDKEGLGRYVAVEAQEMGIDLTKSLNAQGLSVPSMQMDVGPSISQNFGQPMGMPQSGMYNPPSQAYPQSGQFGGSRTPSVQV